MPRSDFAEIAVHISVLLVAQCGALAAAPQVVSRGSFTIDAAEGATGPLKINLSKPGGVPLRLIYKPAKSEAAPQQVTISPSVFLGEGGTFLIRVKLDCDTKTSSETLAVNGLVTPFCLEIPAISADGAYAGNLLIQSKDTDLLIKPVVITQARTAPAPAVLVVGEQKPADIDVGLPFRWYPGYSDAERTQANVTVAVLEKTGKAAVEGVRVRLEQVAKSPGSFGGQNVRYFWNGNDAKDLDISQDPGRTIPAGGQAKVGLQFHGLRPGDYSVVYRFSGWNTGAADDAQKLTLNFHVRDSWGWAVGCLLLAMLLSFVATKVVTAQRRRLDLLQQIHDLKQSGLAFFTQAPTVVWARAMLDQTEKLSSRGWLTSPDLIESRVNAVRNTIKILDQARKLHMRLRGDTSDWLVSRLLSLELEELVSRLGTWPLDDAAATAIGARLTAFGDWFNKDKVRDVLWNDIQPYLQALKEQMDGARVPASEKQQYADLCAHLEHPPQDANGVRNAYREYARLRVIWDHREVPNIAKLVAIHDLRELLEAADQTDWEKIKKSGLQVVVPPNSEVREFEAFAPVQFGVKVSSPDGDAVDHRPHVDDSYLFRHKVEYRWKFELTPAERKRWQKVPGMGPQVELPLTPVTMGPTVSQYFPSAAKVKVSVQLFYQGDPGPEIAATHPLTVKDSDDFRFLSAFQRVEFVSWGIAAATAIASGLGMFYVKNAGFGSFQDYLTLFLWGLGVDQGKNFVQALQPGAFSGGKPG
jgi:hypothetical protein